MLVASVVAWSRSLVLRCWAIIGVGLAAFLLQGSGVSAKVPGAKHCYNGICHRIMTLAETEKAVGTRTTAKTSFYDDCSVDRFNTCALTSSGEVFKPHRPDNAASPIYPDGTKLLLWNPKTQMAAVVRVNSAGPYHSNRTLDVSRATAEKLGFKRTGVATLHLQVLEAPTPAESRYKKRREYAPVPGPIGAFKEFEMAAANALKFFPRAMSRMFAGDVPPLARSAKGAAPVVMASISVRSNASTAPARQAGPAAKVPDHSRHQVAAKPLFSGLMMSRAPMSSVRVQQAFASFAAPGKLSMGGIADGNSNSINLQRSVSATRKPQTYSAAFSSDASRGYDRLSRSAGLRRALGSGS